MPNLIVSANVDSFMGSADYAAMRALLGLREVLSANRTYYVRADGNDANTGLTNDAAGAFATWAKARDVLATLDGGGFVATVKGTGTFTEAVLWDKTFVGFSKIVLEGDVATPSNCTISPVSGTYCLKVDSLGTPFELRGLTIGNSAVVSGLEVNKGDVTIAGVVNFTACSSHHMLISGQKAEVRQRSGYSISGAASVHVATYDQAAFDANGSAYTVTITGTPAFATAFVVFDRAGGGLFVNITYSGATTGPQYQVGPISYIKAVGTTFPGSGSSVNPLGSYS